MRALFASLALILIAGCGTREASAPGYVCDRLATQGSQPFECVPQGAPRGRDPGASKPVKGCQKMSVGIASPESDKPCLSQNVRVACCAPLAVAFNPALGQDCETGSIKCPPGSTGVGGCYKPGESICWEPDMPCPAQRVSKRCEGLRRLLRPDKIPWGRPHRALTCAYRASAVAFRSLAGRKMI